MRVPDPATENPTTDDEDGVHADESEDVADGDAESDRVDPDPAGAAPPRRRKERVLHTRIPAVLEAELKAAAEALRVPVSNLVRTILEDAVDIADRATGHVEARIASAARSVLDDRERHRRAKRASPEPKDPLAGIVALQPVVVAARTACAKCGVNLEPGDDAAVGIGDLPGPKPFVCVSCMPKKSRPASDWSQRNE